MTRNLRKHHTYPDIFESATLSFQIQNIFHPHVAYSNRICPPTRIRIRSSTQDSSRKHRQQSMRHKEIIIPSAAILRIDFTVRSWARSCYVIRIKIFPDLASTRFRIHNGLKNIQSGERIQRVLDSPANSPDTCGRKSYPERKGVFFSSFLIVKRKFGSCFMT